MGKKKPLKSLTPKEKTVLEFIEDFLSKQEISPSYQEIKDHFGFKSFFSVQRYIKQLSEKKYIRVAGNNQKRSIELLNSSSDFVEDQAKASSLEPSRERVSNIQASSDTLSLPLLGKVAAGIPLEHIKHDEHIPVPSYLVRAPSKSFVLEVDGDSMVEDGIFEGDYLVIQEQQNSNQGSTVVAMVDNEATVKHFFDHRKELNTRRLKDHQLSAIKKGRTIELRPANSFMESMFFHPKDVEIKGLVVGLIRKF
ncbi:MAG: transcriptional repressor LexA [Bdellovibrionales bacterium]